MKNQPKLYNKLRDSYAIWNGDAWEDKDVPGAYFYSLEKAENNGYYPVKNGLVEKLITFIWLLGLGVFVFGVALLLTGWYKEPHAVIIATLYTIGGALFETLKPERWKKN